MGSVARAVVEFDESVLAPWRPPLAAGATVRRAPLRAVPDPAPRHPVGPRPAPVRPGEERTARPVHRRPALSDRSHPATSGRPDAPALRLTRRARRLGAVLGLAVGVALGSWVGSAVTADEPQLRLVGESSVVVQSGDTLWSIAAAVAGDEDVRPVIGDIRELNGLADASLVPGQVLLLP